MNRTILQPKQKYAIGNYVKANGNLYEVTTLSEKEIMVVRGMDGHYHYVNVIMNNPLVDIKPIPLDAEWLEDLGIEVKRNEPCQGDVSFALCGCTWSNLRYASDRPFYAMDFNGGNTLITYVHELQNLWLVFTGRRLSLCNVQKHLQQIRPLYA